MADLVLGLAKSAVEGTVSMTKTAIEEEEKIQKSVKRDLMLISDEFETMNSFLRVIGDRITNDMTRTLVRQVRTTALDVEDCIESVIHLDRSRWWLRMLPFFLPAARSVAALNEVVNDIELLKARIEAMGQRQTRYNHVGDSNPVTQVQQHAVEKTAAFYVLEKARETSKKGNLIDLIRKERGNHPRQVVAVWGTGGDLGMTPIIRKAYMGISIDGADKLFDCRAWVKLTQPFNPHLFLRSLLTQFYASFNPQQGCNVDVRKMMREASMTAAGLEEALVRHFRNKQPRYLVVLEGISSMDEWDSIMAYLPDWKNRSCIIVHTQGIEIASLCVGHSCQCSELKVSELKRFSVDHSVFVFYNESGEEADEEPASGDSLEHVGQQKKFGTFFIEGAFKKNINVVSVWGIAGVGKSSLVKHMRNEVMARYNIKKHGWANVSHPFNLRDLSWRLLLDLHSESLHRILEISDPVQECYDLLHQNSCIIVIDGLQSTEEWDSIEAALVTERFKSHIIVITYEERVAKYCAKSAEFNVKSLEVDDAFKIFREKVCRELKGEEVKAEDGEQNLDPKKIERSKDIIHSYLPEIVPKCGGLPKVIVAVADFLVSQLEKGEDDLIEDRCRRLKDSFMHTIQNNRAFDGLQDMFSWVDSYFHTCPDSLKPCIFYLSIFPINQIIRRRRLVRRWIAEGYSRATKECTAEEKAEEFMSNLVKLCMIQLLDVTTAMDFFRVRMPLCQVNAFFREYIMSQPIEENLVFSLEGRCTVNSQRTGRHLAILDSWDRDKIVFQGIDFSRLRSLTVFGEWRSFFISDKMRLLRVIDLENTSGLTNTDLEMMVKLLSRLKFLSLRGCREITRLPDSLGDLKQLQTLDVRNTSIVELPSTITKLKKLEYVRAGTTVPSGCYELGTVESPPRSRLRTMCKFFRSRPADSGGVEVPRGFGKLPSLHTLGVVNISGSRTGGKVILKNLKKNLTQLHKLGVCGVNQRNSQQLCSAISGHGHLESLSVQLDKKNQDGCLDKISTPPENLRSLKLYGMVGKLPVWIRGLMNLNKLDLRMTTILMQDDIDVLGDLPKLQILSLCCKEFQDGKLQFPKGFEEVYVLEITCNSRLKAVTFADEGAMESVEILRIRCSSVSLLRFTGLEGLEQLTKVSLSGFYDEALKEHLQIQLGTHPNKPVTLKEERHWNQVRPQGY
ncbi:hypothetical protein ACP70R_047746 [Stipagrostis hirtigluma subsp. patula]